MHKSTINWNDIQYFLSVARSGSARITAQSLGISHSTVSRRIENLEKDLDTRLFDRGVSGYRLTAEGQEMINYAEQAEDALVSAELHLQGRDTVLSGDIRVTTPDVIANHLLMPEVAQFTQKYRDINLEFNINSDVFELMRGESDIAIRIMEFANPVPEPLIGRKLADIASCYYSSDDYLSQHDPSAVNSDARWIGWGHADKYPQWVKESPYPHIPTQYFMNQAGLQLEAARAGMGMVLLPCFYADNASGIKRLPDSQPKVNHEVWLLSHPDHREVARLRKFREFIVELFEQKKDMLSGKQTGQA
ncbi:LysR family transcriptional regulator [Thalassomonas haliotis]|uniref:LysR family transcriptional regulator n=1 Tax=Thalassomonas haliotis TaxID=485448 RepID=A0ABY7VIV3_9GAMM|nr:LysR family transcriptional regulator [Thalassomonas haliotis]WDE12612.1 LysR family transcriptional regulator [Thalassomonas haliotis]